MKRKNAARNALVTSIVSLLLCVSMLVGTTFAWFTDEVVTGMNTIAAGNLDVELKVDGVNVNATTELFKKDEPWEPGVVVYENLQVVNVGTLALKYQMTLNFGDENNLNGHKLSEVLKVAVIDKVDANATREQVLAAAEAAIAASGNDGALNNFRLTGELEAGTSATEQTVVIFWAPNANEVDNLYNANNGQVTSDGQPLHIQFGINLQATQKMSEEDSFGPDYDEGASILPHATVNNQGVKTVTATIGIGGAAQQFDLPFTLQFLPNETLEQAQASEYRYWHADYVVKADKPVAADSIGLLGYYNEWCQFNNDNWVAMINADQDIAANTEIRLVELLGATVNYEEICHYGNDPEDLLPAELEGFLCGAIDLTGANAGTTITVELRLYETEEPSEANGNSHNVETGNYEVIGTYNYTFPRETVTDPINDNEGRSDYEGELFDSSMTDGMFFQGEMLTGDATITATRTYETIALENVVANVNGNLITCAADNTIILHNCDITLDDGEMIIVTTEGVTIGQVMIHNVTVNGELLTQANASQYMQGVNWYEVW